MHCLAGMWMVHRTDCWNFAVVAVVEDSLKRLAFNYLLQNKVKQTIEWLLLLLLLGWLGPWIRR